jgi:hypothetical protein
MKRYRLGLIVVVLALTLAATGQSSDNPRLAPSDSTPGPAPTPQPDLTPDANGKLSQEQMQALFRVVADKDLANDKRQRDYTYIEHDVDNHLDGQGQTKSTDKKTFEILDIYGAQVQRLIEKDGKPLDPREAQKEDEKIQKIIDKRKNESEEERKKRESKEDKDREDGRAFVRDIADAYNFTLVGTETLGGREVYVIDGQPRTGFVPHAKDAKYLSKFRGRVWIDKSDLQLAKLDVECLNTVSWGLFLARFHKGTRFMLEQTRVNDEVWLPLHVTYKVDARLGLVKGIDVEGDQTYSDYKKFRTSSKIVRVGEVREQK